MFSVFAAAIAAIAAAGILSSCTTRVQAAKEIGIVVCEQESLWHGTFFYGGPAYPNERKERQWLVICEDRASVVSTWSHKESVVSAEYRPGKQTVKVEWQGSGGGFLSGDRLRWTLTFCEASPEYSRFSHRSHSAHTKGLGVASLLDKIKTMFEPCTPEQPKTGM